MLRSGRVSVLAVLGHIVTTAGVRFPGDVITLNVVRIPAGIAPSGR
jgi:hypothetical protein